MIKRSTFLSATSALILFALAIYAHAAAPMRWVSYKSNLLGLQVSVPSDWRPAKIPKALAFRYDDLVGGSAGIGILKSTQNDQTIEEAADKEFQREGRPTDWVRTPANVDGRRAIKIVGIDPKNPDRKIVHYYIATDRGNYIVQCQASANQWSTFSPIFTTILMKLKFMA